MPTVQWPAYSAGAAFVWVSAAGFALLAAQTIKPHPQTPLTVELPRVEIVAQQPDDSVGAFAALRRRMHWVPTRFGGDTLMAPDYESRVLLAKSAAERAGLGEVGLTYRDVYAIISAETSWIPRTGASRDGTPNLGIAQFEPATARALGVKNPQDPVEAVHAAAMHMKDAALWSREKLRPLNLGRVEQAEKLREGVSVYYNLSTRGRNQWNGTNAAQLPVETQRHIANARLGAQEAAMLEAQLRASSYSRGREVVTAKAADTRG